jgi:hypothetical protein
MEKLSQTLEHVGALETGESVDIVRTRMDRDESFDVVDVPKVVFRSSCVYLNRDEGIDWRKTRNSVSANIKSEGCSGPTLHHRDKVLDSSSLSYTFYSIGTFSFGLLSWKDGGALSLFVANMQVSAAEPHS